MFSVKMKLKDYSSLQHSSLSKCSSKKTQHLLMFRKICYPPWLAVKQVATTAKPSQNSSQHFEGRRCTPKMWCRFRPRPRASWHSCRKTERARKILVVNNLAVVQD